MFSYSSFLRIRQTGRPHETPDIEHNRSYFIRKKSIIAAIALVAIGIHLILRFGVETDRDNFRLSPAIDSSLGRLDLRHTSCRWSGDSPITVWNSAPTCSRVFRSSRRCCSANTWPERSSCSCFPAARRWKTYAVRRASFALEALARRMPSVAHRQMDGGDGRPTA